VLSFSILVPFFQAGRRVVEAAISISALIYLKRGKVHRMSRRVAAFIWGGGDKDRKRQTKQGQVSGLNGESVSESVTQRSTKKVIYLLIWHMVWCARKEEGAGSPKERKRIKNPLRHPRRTIRTFFF